jgi:hypothetical protein
MENEFSTHLQQLLSRLTAIEKQIQTNASCPEIRRDWIPRREVMLFLGFKDTRMTFIIDKYKLLHSKIGAKQFISTKSLKDLLSNESSFKGK